MRVLVVEDNTLIALDMADMVERAGFEVIGPATSLTAAERLMRKAEPDAAVLDIDLGRGADTFALARRLRGAGKPVIFLSSHAPEQRPLPEDLSGLPRMGKPYSRLEAMEALARLL